MGECRALSPMRRIEARDFPRLQSCTGEPMPLIARLQAPINKSTSLTTENVTVQQAGDDVYVEQLSTIVDGDGTHVSMVCHIFSVCGWGSSLSVRGYRNERGLPAG